jgi:hypothetical protein
MLHVALLLLHNYHRFVRLLTAQNQDITNRSAAFFERLFSFLVPARNAIFFYKKAIYTRLAEN